MSIAKGLGRVFPPRDWVAKQTSHASAYCHKNLALPPSYSVHPSQHEKPSGSNFDILICRAAKTAMYWDFAALAGIAATTAALFLVISH